MFFITWSQVYTKYQCPPPILWRKMSPHSLAVVLLCTINGLKFSVDIFQISSHNSSFAYICTHSLASICAGGIAQFFVLFMFWPHMIYPRTLFLRHDLSLPQISHFFNFNFVPLKVVAMLMLISHKWWCLCERDSCYISYISDVLVYGSYL